MLCVSQIGLRREGERRKDMVLDGANKQLVECVEPTVVRGIIGGGSGGGRSTEV